MQTLRIKCLMVVTVAFAYGLDEACAERTLSIVTEREIGDRVVQSERDEQEALFNYYFRDQKLQYKTEFAALKTEGTRLNDATRLPRYSREDNYSKRKVPHAAAPPVA